MPSNLIFHIDDGTFVDLVELRFLDMNNNKLTNLTDNMFQGLSKLKVLCLDNNSIKYIAPAAFQFLFSLQTLALGSNHLHQFADLVPILQLPHLDELQIGDNIFTSFQSKDLPVNMSSDLRILELILNPLEKFSITRDIFPHLQTLDFSKCTSDIEWDNQTEITMWNRELLKAWTIS
ncbi:uncharacterized protein ACN63O_018147 [Diretmus argenteus]